MVNAAMPRNQESGGIRNNSGLQAKGNQNGWGSPGPAILWPAMPVRRHFMPADLEHKTPLDIHVWAASLDLPASLLQGLRLTLCPAEVRRADRFHFPEHCARFIAGRGLLRAVLGKCLGAEPGTLEFQYGKHGKPELTGQFAATGLQFNLAHCENLALIAVARNARIGIDVERVRVLTDAGELVTRFFSPRESAAFHALSTAQQPEAFFHLWTRKEAWLKATGLGISQYLAQLEVTFLPGAGARLVTLPESMGADEPWSLRELRPAKGFAAALCVQADIGEVNCWRWELSDIGQSAESPFQA